MTALPRPGHRRRVSREAVRRLGGSLLAAAVVASLASCAYHQENRRGMADAYYQQARAYLQEGRGVENELNRRRAHGLLKEAILRDPENAAYHIDLGVIYLYDRRYEEARVEIEEALKLQPGNPVAHEKMGLLHATQGRYEEALKEFDTALSDYSYQTPWIVHFNKGQAYFNLEDWARAADSFRAALGIAPGMEAAWYGLGQSLDRLNRPADSEKAYRKALEINFNAARTHYYLGLSLFAQKKNAEAVTAFKRVLELDAEGELGRNASRYLSILK